METLKLAVQKSGRLSEKSLQFIKECGISYAWNKAKLRTQSYNFPLELLFLRDDDIPKYVADGVADIGIIGENVMVEKGKKVDLVERMGFSRCRLSLAVPQTAEYNGISDLNGKKIATSYPFILQKHLEEQGVSAEIHEISGSVEIAPSIGLADAVCDLVSTGSTLLSNGLKEVEVILRSEAVMIATPGLSDEKQEILDKLLFRVRSALRAQNFKYILMNAPNSAIGQIASILPGMRSPTVTPLEEQGWSSVHTVVKEDDFWEVIENLRKVGAEGILVIPIEKMIL
ncbi:MAG: ATP phosphoribosyltransferase [Bacteroidota bacterium]